MRSFNSVGRDNFKVMVQWARRFIFELNIGPHQVGVALFNNMYNNIFTLNQFDNNEEMIQGTVVKCRTFCKICEKNKNIKKNLKKIIFF